MNAAGRYGLMASFADPHAFLATVKRARADGFTQLETYTPCPVEGLDELLMPKRSNLPAIMLGGAAFGAAFGFGLQVYAARDYPLDVGGRPLFSWPAFVPVTFELGVLTAVVTGLLVFLWRARFPQYHHPVFGAPGFERASVDRFMVCVRADDPKFVTERVRALLAEGGPEAIEEVPS